ncbi:MAG: peptidylprolyl isomerase [Chlorobi bacterium]|nr:peptidylprolyl isomerase [Chlorobiota bacterium]
MKKIIIFALILGLFACSNETKKSETVKETAKQESAQAETNQEQQQVAQPEKTETSETPEKVESPSENNNVETKIIISTDYGEIMLKLYNETPGHRDNMIKLIIGGWYKNSPFHRIIKNFMIQGGQNADGRVDPGYTIPAEFVHGYIHKKGALAAARMGDNVNPAKESSGCQFYIVQGKKMSDAELNMIEKKGKFNYTPEQREVYKTIGGTPFLDYSYTVFGEVVSGLEVVDKIASVRTGKGDVPVKPVVMNISIVEL